MNAMRIHMAVLLVLLALAGTTSAQDVLERGDLMLRMTFEEGGFLGGTPPPDVLEFFDTGGREKQLAFPRLGGVRGVLAPDAARAFVTTTSRVVYVVTDGIAAEPIRGLILQAPGEIVPMRSGDFLVAESGSVHTKPRIVQIDSAGRIVREGSLIHVPNPFGNSSWWLGVAHMELLADQCTIVWNTGDGGLSGLRGEALRVRRFDICRGTALPDLFTLPFDAEPGSLRQLPDGDLLIAAGSNVRRYDLRGTLRATYSVQATVLALTPDASGFWAVHTHEVHRVDFASPDLIAVRFTTEHLGGLGIAVVGEWRAAMQFPRRRVARK